MLWPCLHALYAGPFHLINHQKLCFFSMLDCIFYFPSCTFNMLHMLVFFMWVPIQEGTYCCTRKTPACYYCVCSKMCAHILLHALHDLNVSSLPMLIAITVTTSIRAGYLLLLSMLYMLIPRMLVLYETPTMLLQENSLACVSCYVFCLHSFSNLQTHPHTL